MKQVLTVKLKLTSPTEQKLWLRDVLLTYRDALNYAARGAFDKGKRTQVTKHQKWVYYSIRSISDLPAPMVCNRHRRVGATYKELWAYVKPNKTALKQGWTNKWYKGLDNPHQPKRRTGSLNKANES
jgi:predicted transposase